MYKRMTAKKPIAFTKMHGIGNDFVIINNLMRAFDISQFPIAKMADRHFGIGFDQLLILEPAKRADFFCSIFNADGTEAEQCGNGLRCISRLVHEEGLLTQKAMRLETKAGIFETTIDDYDHIRVSMGVPKIQKNLMNLESETNSNPVQITVLSLGNPHAIVKVDSVDALSNLEKAAEISQHAYFSHGVNVGVMQVIHSQHIRLRTFERGTGETYACGSNACAAVIAGSINGWIDNLVKVEFAKGLLTVEWSGSNNPVYMTGPATRVFTGEVFY